MMRDTELRDTELRDTELRRTELRGTHERKTERQGAVVSRAVRLTLLLVLVITACSDSTGPAWVGTYSLDTFAGRPLPTLIAGEPELSLLSGELVLRQNGTYRERLQTSAGDQVRAGSYTVDGVTLQLDGFPALIMDSLITMDACISGQQGCREVGETRYVRR